MARSKVKRLWLIQGFEGLTETYTAQFPLSRYSVKQVEDLLRLLYARVALNEREITEAVGRKRTSLLEVHHGFKSSEWMCGSNPYFIARII